MATMCQAIVKNLNILPHFHFYLHFHFYPHFKNKETEIQVNNLSKATQVAPIEDLHLILLHRPLAGVPKIPQKEMGNKIGGRSISLPPGPCLIQQEWSWHLLAPWSAPALMLSRYC